MPILSVALDALAWVAATWYAVIWCICLFGLYRTRRMFLKVRDPAPASHQSASLPSVSILRPLSGLDSDLYDNLAATFELQYPADKYEVIFSVASPQDAALHVAHSVVQKYAHANGPKATIIVGDVAAGVNPKVNNLLRPYAEAQHDLLWVLDSQVKPSPLSLLSSVSHFDNPKVGLVHHVPLGVLDPQRSTTLGSRVERAFLATTHAKMYVALNSIGIDSCVMGKSNMWRKSDLERVPDSFFAVGGDGLRKGDGEGALGSEAFRLAYGGDESGDDGHSSHRRILQRSRPLARFSIYLAEDNMLALSLWRPPLSLSHVLAPSPSCVARTNVAEIRTIRDYIARRSRWIRVRRYMVPAATWLEPFTESIVAMLTGATAAYRLDLLPQSTIGRLTLAALHFGLWLAVDLGVLSALNHSQHSHGSPVIASLFTDWSEASTFICAWCVRELLAWPIWFYAMWGGNEVTWRGQPYRILSDSRAAKMQSRSGNGQNRLRGLLDGVSSASPSSSVARYEALSTSEDHRVMD
ncbi:unnamed protein product [Jaminaea pallidilutea]